jgi:hypothetical protein
VTKKNYNRNTTIQPLICQFAKNVHFISPVLSVSYKKHKKCKRFIYPDVFAHTDLQMATRYVWDVSKQTDEVIRLWWIPFLIPHKAKFARDYPFFRG